MSCKRFASAVVSGAFLLLLPAAAWAQSSLGGVARDASGAVLPGVTVEAASPALIEQVRVAVTDGQGVYLIVDLRPGPYEVTFTLPGFQTFVRNGLELRAVFAATVDAEMVLGQIEETITVTGEAPLVDIRSTRGQTQFQEDTLQSVPGTGRLAMLQNVIPGANLNRPTDRSVGGLNDRPQTNWSLHGAPSSRPVVDGMNYQLAALSQGVMVYNQDSIQEVVVETSGVGADRDTGGMQLNMIMKEGSNVFSGGAAFSYLGPSNESSNISDDLLARGLNPDRVGSIKKWRDSSVSLGGPIVQDKVWFFGAAREGVTQLFSEFAYYNSVNQPESFLYVPDLSRPGFTNEYAKDITVRVTAQVTDRHKFVAGVIVQPNCNCYYNLLHATSPRDPKATGDHNYNPNWVPTATWTFPATSRLLFEAGFSGQLHFQKDTITEQPGLGSFAQKPTDIRIQEQSPRIFYGAVGTRYLPRSQFQQRFAVTYVTGSHNFKTGVLFRQMRRGDINSAPPGGGNDVLQYGVNAYEYRFRRGVPNRVILLDSPWNYEESVRDIALYAQDQWTINRLTVNLGVRFNNAVGSTPEQVLGAGRWVPERRFASETNVPNWTNLSPRLGAAYDLFGTGQTALKVSLGRYPVQTETASYNPARDLSRRNNISWNDANGNFIPDCDLANPLANGECGRWGDLNFGQVRAGVTVADDANSGFNLQAHHWEGSVSLQHELAPGVGLNVGYFRTWYGGFLVQDNRAVTAGDFDEFCVTSPTDSALGVASGKEFCGLYDVTPAKFGQNDNLLTQSSNYGDGQSQVFNGVDVSLNARFLEGGLFQGGLSVGRTVVDTCFAVGQPQLLDLDTLGSGGFGPSNRPDFCRVVPGWADSTQVKFMFVYPLPYGVQISAIYQNAPGIPVLAEWTAENSDIAPSLGRNLSEGRRGSVDVPLIQPGTMFEDRGQQIDLRFSKIFELLGSQRIRGNFDIFNVTNQNDVLRQVLDYGSRWRNVQQILGGRLLKASVRFDF